MPFFSEEKTDWKLNSERRTKYKRQLIKKGVLDGSSKMMKLLSRKFK